MELSESLEDYLEAIYLLLKEKKVVRVKDLMQQFGYKVSSVNNAVKNLRKKGLVEHEKYSYIDLTEKGENVAREIYAKHENIYRFFHEILGISEKNAWNDACRIEHILSEETYTRFMEFYQDLEDKE